MAKIYLSKWTTILIIFVAMAAAISVRIWDSYDYTFGYSYIRFNDGDGFYHMRLINNFVHNFPYLMEFDPYTKFPYGQDVIWAPLYTIIVGSVIWVIGLGHPSQHMVDVIGAYFPCIFASLIVIPTYFVAKWVWGRNAGIVAALVLSISSGEILSRSILGFTDHHIAESLFSALSAMFLILSIKKFRGSGLGFRELFSWNDVKKYVPYFIISGIMLSAYLLTWIGGLLFVSIIVAFAVAQFIIDQWSGRSTREVCIPVVATLTISAIIVFLFPYHQGRTVAVALIMSVIALLITGNFADLLGKKMVFRILFVVLLFAVAVAGIALSYHVDKSLLLEAREIFLPGTASKTISEVQPLFSKIPDGPSAVWNYFGVGFYAAIGAMVVLAMLIIKDRKPEVTFVFIWCVVMLFATISQRRFSYYYSVNVSILCGVAVCFLVFAIWKFIEWIGFFRERDRDKVKKENKRRKKVTRGAKYAKAEHSMEYTIVNRMVTAILSLGLLVGLMYPSICQVKNLKSALDTPQNEDWSTTLFWMRDNTPDPFGNSNYYYSKYPSSETKYTYPDSAYGVASWWDYGHWITTMAKRIPNANPFGAGSIDVAKFFTSQCEEDGNKILEMLRSRYVIIDFDMSDPQRKFYAMVQIAGGYSDDFYEIYVSSDGSGNYTPQMIYYPAFYRSMCSRLYGFGGEVWTPELVIVISTNGTIDDKGETYKIIGDSQQFGSYGEALQFVEQHPNYRIIGSDPYVSPVPLEKLLDYKSVYSSPTTVIERGNDKMSVVEVFEYFGLESSDS